MPRAVANRWQSGAVSALFISACLPFFLALTVIGMEVSQFYGARESLQEIVDGEAHASLRHGFSQSEVARRIASRVEEKSAQLTVSGVVMARTSPSSTVAVEGTYHGLLSDMLGGLLGTASDGLVFKVQAVARRARLGALVVLDRGVASPEVMCSDTRLLARREMVARLTRALRDAGVASVSVAVVPGSGGDAVTVLGVSTEIDGIPRCGAAGIGDLEGVGQVSGISGGAPDSLDVAYSVLSRFSAIVNPTAIETGALVMVSGSDASRVEPVTTTLALLEGALPQIPKHVYSVAVAEGGGSLIDPFTVRPGESSGVSHFVSTTSGDLIRPDLVSAIVGQVYGATFLSQ